MPLAQQNIQCISMFVTAIIGKSTSQYNIDSFVHPKLSQHERQFGTRLGFDTWADTSCADKHAYVESFIDGKTVTAGGFTPSLGKISGLPIANVLYAHDTQDGTVIIFREFPCYIFG